MSGGIAFIFFQAVFRLEKSNDELATLTKNQILSRGQTNIYSDTLPSLHHMHSDAHQYSSRVPLFLLEPSMTSFGDPLSSSLVSETLLEATLGTRELL